MHEGLLTVVNVLINGLVKEGYISKKTINDKVKSNDIGGKILRSLGEYAQLDEDRFLNSDGTLNRFELKEYEIEMNMSINEPDFYHIGNWKEIWDKQKPLRTEQWLKETEDVRDEDTITRYY